ncbi:phytanoyl-CoA dioxygenase family protein [Amycolatopsis sp. FDAARGOS 1241]|uniref:phytanoyl-CoA dioxygenase family protein n=1 Tax=Amycolatopsis sp. FDAARGOS 1241 TaxID=2778070 RepID=UPI00194DCF53|nr:phytanoyl-CoA dioxygenase family protein [Amycolatopsis sp. FDAARGOS 1241]QRP50091.1 phytanoyl-CoA dioxygenase family protein [Amycolatopsis sp. FDAARGOS 1241]
MTTTVLPGGAASAPRFERPLRPREREGPFGPAELAAYHRDGYVEVPGLLGVAEVEAVRARLARLIAQPAAARPVSSLWLVGELARDSRLLDRARQILGARVRVHHGLIDDLPAFAGKGFAWRSDLERWHTGDDTAAPRAMTVSLVLCANLAVNGGLLLIPGSHRTIVSRSEGALPVEVIRGLTDRRGIHQFTGAPGTALFFDAHLLHGSGDNITPYPRTNVSVTFTGAEPA